MFINKWKDLTSDKSIIDTIQGYRLSFEFSPPTRNKCNNPSFSAQEIKSINNEIETLLKKRIIEETAPSPFQYVTHIFTRPKKDGSHRVILNLKSLNEYIENFHFKMDSLNTAINLMKENCYFGSIDLKDAFFSIPVANCDRKYLRFTWNGKLYQFTCLAQGLSTCPRIFTKLMKCVFSHLRKKGYCNTAYIDDSLLIGDSMYECEANIRETVELVDSLGLTIHPKKSVLIPKQEIQYLGFILNSVDMSAKLTPEKATKIKSQCQTILSRCRENRNITIRDVSELIGKMIASEPGVPYAKLFHKRIEIEKNRQLRQSKGNFDANIVLSENCQSDIQWWIDNIEISKQFLAKAPPTVVIKSDSSGFGWGGVLGDKTTGGHWSESEKRFHINYLELLAVYMTLQSFCSSMNGVHIRSLIDNSTSVCCINKHGSMKSALNDITRKIILWCKQRNIWLSAAHLPGSQNCEADYESRHQNDDTEWELDNKVFKTITEYFGNPCIDLFASRLNNKLKEYSSYKPDPHAKFVDAFSENWGTNFCYIFPPFSVIGPVLKKITEDKAEVILVAPLWPTQSWFPKMLHLLVDCPRLLPVSKTLLTLPSDKTKSHPLLQKLHLTAFRLSGNPSKTRDYQRMLSKLSCNHGVIQLKNNIGVISKSGCVFAMRDKLIPCHQL